MLRKTPVPVAAGRLLLTLLFAIATVGWTGCSSWRNREPVENVPRFFLEAGAQRSAAPGAAATDTVVLPVSQSRISIYLRPVFAEHNIQWVQLYEVDRGFVLGFQLNSTGTRELTRLSVQNIGYRLVLVVDGDPIGARRIDGIMEDGMIYTFVELPDEELLDLLEDLQTGLSEARKRMK